MTHRLLLWPLLTIALLVPGTSLGASGRSGSPAASHSHRTHRHALSYARLAPVTIRDPASTAVAIAERYWGAVPCRGDIKVVVNSPLAPGLDPSTDGWVTFNSSQGANNLAAAANTYTNCTISLAHWQWASWTDMESDWGMFCLTMTHEMGHLLGYKHSLNPSSVMAPVFTSDANVPAICHASWLAGWRSAGAR